jgi:hypothetical protein
MASRRARYGILFLSKHETLEPTSHILAVLSELYRHGDCHQFGRIGANKDHGWPAQFVSQRDQEFLGGTHSLDFCGAERAQVGSLR